MRAHSFISVIIMIGIFHAARKCQFEEYLFFALYLRRLLGLMMIHILSLLSLLLLCQVIVDYFERACRAFYARIFAAEHFWLEAPFISPIRMLSRARDMADVTFSFRSFDAISRCESRADA